MAGGAGSNTLMLVFFELDAQRLREGMQARFGGAINWRDRQRDKGEAGCNVYDGGVIYDFQVRQELLDHANGAKKVGLNFAADVLEGICSAILRFIPPVLEIELAHDSGVVDEHVQSGKLFYYGFEKDRNRAGFAHVALKCMDSGKFLLGFVKATLISSGDDDGVAKLQKFSGKLESDAAGAAGD